MAIKPLGSLALTKPAKDQEEYLQRIAEQTKFDQYFVSKCNCVIGAPKPTRSPPCPVHGKVNFGEVQFDPDLSPNHIQNKTAARDRNLRYDAKRRAYVDSEGALVRDRFGQPY